MSHTRIKICGITRPEDALLAAKLGTDAIGMVFYSQSPRCISAGQAKKIVELLPAFVTVVGLFVNQDLDAIYSILETVHLDLLQFQGQETAEFCQQFNKPYVKAFHMQPGVDLNESILPYKNARAILLDTYHPQQAGGTGIPFDWHLIPRNLSKPVILAGGLNTVNVGEAVHQVRPYGVDVSSGIEVEPGIKDPAKIQAFINEVRRADRE